jgi:hypothetical protein
VLALMLTLHLVQPPMQAPVYPRRMHLLAFADAGPVAPYIGGPVSDLDPQEPNRPVHNQVAGSTAGSRRVAGAAGVLVGNGVAIVAGMATWIVFVTAESASANDDFDGSTPLLAGIGVLIATDLILVPLAACLAEEWASDGPLAGSFASGWLRAGLVHAAALTFLTVVVAAIGHLDIAELPDFVIFAAVDLVLVPMAASWGLHDGPARVQPSPAAAVRSEMPALASNRPMQQVMNLGFQF